MVKDPADAGKVIEKLIGRKAPKAEPV